MKTVSFLATVLPAAVTACAPLPVVEVPPQLAAGPGHVLVQVVPARGVQIYECRAGGDGAPAWVLVAPEATLFDARGSELGSHGAGPFWQSRDGSRITGKVAARADAPVANAVPWLLLDTQAGSKAAGDFSAIARIQRVNTVGGVAPAGGCSKGALGNTVRVPYAADYYLFAARPR